MSDNFLGAILVFSKLDLFAKSKEGIKWKFDATIL